MFKNESIEIKPTMNGYRIDYDYRISAGKEDGGYNYVSEEYGFQTWEEVIDFVSNKKLETPPAKI